MDFESDWQDDYLAWILRLNDTRDSVRYMVTHRLEDRTVAEAVAMQVVVSMLARPRVFRYQGLPYAGRIAALAEPLIADPDGDWRAQQCSWEELAGRLFEMPTDLRNIHVAAHVHGLSAAEKRRADAGPEPLHSVLIRTRWPVVPGRQATLLHRL